MKLLNSTLNPLFAHAAVKRLFAEYHTLAESAEGNREKLIKTGDSPRRTFERSPPDGKAGAIAHMQRREDVEVRQTLDRLATMNCAPARLVSPLRSLLAGRWEGCKRRLLSAWRPRKKQLAGALSTLDSVFAGFLPKDPYKIVMEGKARGRDKALFARLRAATEAVRLEVPAMTDRFREAAAAKSLMLSSIPLAEIEKPSAARRSEPCPFGGSRRWACRKISAFLITVKSSRISAIIGTPSAVTALPRACSLRTVRRRRKYICIWRV